MRHWPALVFRIYQQNDVELFRPKTQSRPVIFVPRTTSMLPERAKMQIRHNSNVIFEGTDSYNADSYNADLRDADLHGANLFSADLRGTDLRETDFGDADLRSTNLQFALLHIRGANLRHTDLRHADLRGAYLLGAKLPAPTMVLLADWGAVSPARALMRLDASAHPDPKAFTNGGRCPYNGSCITRIASFVEQKDFYSPGPAPTIWQAMCMVLECPGWN